MKLELKEILQHVINGVQIEILNYKSDYVGIQYAKANGYYYLGGKLHITYDGGSTGKSLDDCRLILRPLSDLKHFNTSNEISQRDEIFILKTKTCHWLSYHSTQVLLREHFDISGLIENNLATTLTQLNKTI